MTICSKSAFALLILAAGAAMSADPAVKPQAAADIARYGTFAFVKGDPQQAGIVADRQVRHRLERIVTSQLMNKGYAPAAPGQKAELGVNLAGKVVDKQQVFLVDNPTPYEYYRGRIQAGGYDTEQYREGTVQVDIIDLGQPRLLWNTRVEQALSAGYSEENWKKVERAMAAAFKSLPVRRQAAAEQK
jgi:hypothetical protein